MVRIPDIKPGDLVKVYLKIKEGDKERITPFQGIVVQKRGSNASKTFTVRKISAGIGIERIFPINSPMITKVEIKKKGKVRKAKLNYLRQQKGRRLKTRTAEKVTKEISEGPLKQDDECTIDRPGEETGEGASGQKVVEKT